MASDLDILPGKWHVKVKTWNWEYEFQPDGRVTWHDLASPEKGSGSWASTSTLINMWWVGSTTRESWQRPLSASSNDHTWYESSYFRGKYRIEKSAGPTDQELIDTAFADSRGSLRFTVNRLRQLQAQTNVPGADSASLAGFQREIAVISQRLLVPMDPLSPAFQDGLTKVIRLFDQNLALPKTLTITRASGKCANTTAFARTSVSIRPPNTELCTSWVRARDDLKRDVITHEYFHTLGAGDIHVTSTADALSNANTLAQIAAFINDRGRQRNSDGGERADPPIPPG